MRSHLVRITSEVAALAKSGSISQARNLFDQMPHRDTVAWNAIISGYSHLGLHQESFCLFNDMRFSNANPDHFTYTSVLSACASLGDLKFGQRSHALITALGWKSSLPVNNSLIDMYGKCLQALDAYKVFEEMGLSRNVVSWCSLLFAYVNAGLLDLSCHMLHGMLERVVMAWNTIIAGCARWARPELCLDLFKSMLGEDSCSPDQWTLSAVMNSCSEMSEPCYGHMVHGYTIQSGWENAIEVTNSVLSFYIKFGEENEIQEAVKAVRTFNEVSWNVVIDAYMKIGNLKEACRVFDSVPKKNLISWTSMIAGCVRNGHGEQALSLFINLMRSFIQPDDVTLGAVLHACSNLAALSCGRAVHSHVIKSGSHACIYVSNSLVNMYAKCGDILDSHRAFKDITCKDLISWNTMLFAFGLHGRPVQARLILEQISASGLRPDKVTFIGLLMMCSHSGLIDEGLSLFESMSLKYRLRPGTDHIACMVDMLVRGGKFEKAKEFMNKYVDLDCNLEAGLLEVLVGSYSGCWSDLRSKAKLAERLRALRPDDEMGYIVLSNLYCSSGEWSKSQGLRNVMADRGVWKTCGCSWVEVMNEVRAFVAGNASFSCMEEEARGVLSLIESEIRYPVFGFGWDGIT